MPRNVRNFWVTVRPDGGREYETGPRSADGGCHVLIRNRKEGVIDDTMIEVVCEPFFANGCAMLRVCVYMVHPSGMRTELHSKTTRR